MSRYLDEAQAIADGFGFEHEPDRHRFTLVKDGEVVGEAHYTLLGEDAIDFDHTFVVPAHRGTGLSELLADRALRDEIVRGRRIQASCWFIAGHLRRHPDLAETSD